MSEYFNQSEVENDSSGYISEGLQESPVNNVSNRVSDNDFARELLNIVNDIVSNKIDKSVQKLRAATVTSIVEQEGFVYATVEFLGEDKKEPIAGIQNTTGNPIKEGDNVLVAYTDNVKTGFIVKILKEPPAPEINDKGEFIQNGAILPTACTLLLMTNDNKILAADDGTVEHLACPLYVYED